MYIQKEIYMHNFIFPEETEKLCLLNSVLIATRKLHLSNGSQFHTRVKSSVNTA